MLFCNCIQSSSISFQRFFPNGPLIAVPCTGHWLMGLIPSGTTADIPTGLFSLEMFPGRPYSTLNYLKEATGELRDLFQGPVMIGCRIIALNWKKVGLDCLLGRDWILGRNSWVWGWWYSGTGCSEKLWMAHVWKCSRSSWTGLRAVWPSRKCPCPW